MIYFIIVSINPKFNLTESLQDGQFFQFILKEIGALAAEWEILTIAQESLQTK